MSHKDNLPMMVMGKFMGDMSAYSNMPAKGVNMQEFIRILMFTTILTVFGLQANTWAQTSTTPAIVEEFSELPAETLRDKIRGGLLGQIIGNLNGIGHEMEYIAEPGDVKSYVPTLPEGARTDDDTDFEWVYICAMQDEGTLLLPYSKIAELWRTRINRGIWCSNQYARVLMDLGFEPPLTGNPVLNPWADFNISGQFLCETFGLLAPGMPRTAEEIGLHYTRVAIDGEPAQTTQLFTAMISQAFLSSDIDVLLDVGLEAIDTKSEIFQIVQDVRVWHSTYPENWRKTRQLVKDKYSRYGGEMRDKNGDELYDLQNDPFEQHNLIDSREHNDIANQLRGRIIKHIEKNDDWRAKKLTHAHKLAHALKLGR